MASPDAKYKNPFDKNPFEVSNNSDFSSSQMSFGDTSPIKADSSSPQKSVHKKVRNSSSNDNNNNKIVSSNKKMVKKTFCQYILSCIFYILNCCSKYGKCTPVRIRYWAITAGIIFTLVTTFFITLDLYKLGTQPHILAWFSGGVFVLIAVPMSLYEIFMHLVHFTCPSSQRHIVRIIWMVPIYGVESWLALRYKEYAIYMQAAREFYEAFAILSFLQYLLNNLGKSNDEISKKIQREAKSVNHGFPFCCMRKWKMGKEFLANCKFGVLSYVICKIFTATLTVICLNNGTYGEGKIDFLKGYIWVTLIDNFSQLWALYCLVILYRALHEILAPYNPFAKFAIVKAVVFFSYWQSIVIAIGVAKGYIVHTPFYDTDDVARALQNWMICIEMFLASIAHRYAFSHTEFIDGQDGGICRFFLAMCDSTIPVDFLLELGTFPSFYRRAQMVNGDGYKSVSTDDYETDEGSSNNSDNSNEEFGSSRNNIFGDDYHNHESSGWVVKV